MQTQTQTKPAETPVSVKPQLFSLKTPYVSQGQVDNFVSETDLMKVSIKIYAEGGENFLHTHQTEDHFFIVLEGAATFQDPSGKNTTLHGNQGIMLPRGAYYMFSNTGDRPLVMLRVAATAVQPWVKDSRAWWPGVVDTREPRREPAVTGRYFAEGSELEARR